MCDELKDEDYMFGYVEEASGTSLCDVVTKAGCDDKQSDYIDKWATKPAEARQVQLARLQKMLGEDPKLKAEAKTWIKQRHQILTKLGVQEVEL
mmetsp:Transcript_11096/g.28206  ORF Transcript_11096/g.28206 Transcript_11096/m.28206 type:complete len:94 (+) Transcript_11096:419-700(+)